MRLFRPTILILVLMLSMVFIQAQSADFSEDDCLFDVPSGQEITCGYLTVPENRQTNSGATIELPVVIFHSFSNSPAPDPIIYLEGGPGGSAVAAADLWFNSPLRNDRDVIIFDQRGTGFAEPSLNCDELDDEEGIDAVADCQDRLLSQGIDLTAYNSRENAADVNDLRLALGYDQVNLYGVSYGTRLGLTVMRDFPEGLRSVVLDSVYPPNIDTNYNVAIDTYNLMSLMFADCESDSVCSREFPDLENRFYDALDSLDSNPALVQDPENGEEFELYSGDVLNILFGQLQSTNLISAIPASLDALANGDYDTYYDLASFGADDGGAPMSGDSGGDDMMFSDDAVALVDEILDELFDEEVPIIEDLAIAGDFDGIYDFLLDVFDMDDAEAEEIADAFIAVYSDDFDFDDSDDGGDDDFEESDGDFDMPDIDDDSEGMNYSVQCNEEMPFMSLETAYDLADNAGVPQIVSEGVIPANEFEECDLWESGEADAIENQAVVSDVPTLLLAARYDTATPPEWAWLAAETLSNSYTFEFAGVGHALIDGGDCPVGVAIDFLANPNAEPDASCTNSMGIDYYVP